MLTSSWALSDLKLLTSSTLEHLEKNLGRMVGQIIERDMFLEKWPEKLVVHSFSSPEVEIIQHKESADSGFNYVG